MVEAEQVMTADYNWSGESLETSEIEGLDEAIEQVAEEKGGKTLVRCDDRVPDYDVYWNDKTGRVRVAAVVLGASYEVPNDD